MKNKPCPSKYACEIKGVERFPDGREICDDSSAGKLEYAMRRMEMISRQFELCAICVKPSIALYFDHQDGRGLGANHRDDRILINGRWHNAALCADCNSRKGSQRYEWGGEGLVPMYVPVSRALSQEVA